MQVQQIGDRTVVNLPFLKQGFQTPPGCDFDYGALLMEELDRLAQVLPGRTLVLDFLLVSKAGIQAIGLLIRLRKQLKEAGKELVVCNPPPDIPEILGQIGWSGMLDIRQNYDPLSDTYSSPCAAIQ